LEVGNKTDLIHQEPTVVAYEHVEKILLTTMDCILCYLLSETKSLSAIEQKGFLIFYGGRLFRFLFAFVKDF
ncbi:hypothetical protein MUY27_19275, partial [Mucilaginibacter sp. RS28]